MFPHSTTPGPTHLDEKARPHTYGLLVLAERADLVVTSQMYMTLEAAERKVARTRARGLLASLHLVRLTVVPFTTLADVDLDGGDE